MRRSLSLRKQTLADLTPDDLAAVRGAGSRAVCVSDGNSCGLCELPPITGPITA